MYNDTPDISKYTLWNTYKAYMRGILIKLASYTKKQRMRQIDNLLQSIATKEWDNKENPTPHLTNDILQERQKLRSLLLYKFENHLKYLKANYYGLHNKTGAWLAKKVKAKQLKHKIATLNHPLSHKTLFNPKDIANAFADYYQSLYDLCSDKATPQPSPELINNFLSKVKLPSLTNDQLRSIFQPFTTQEICLIIKKLPNHKSPGDDGF